jgi:hypothetical protein
MEQVEEGTVTVAGTATLSPSQLQVASPTRILALAQLLTPWL